MPYHVAAILSLALGIGACTSAFRLIDALLLRPLPVAHPERLWLLLGLLPLAWWRYRGARRRVRDWVELGQSGRPPGDGSWGWFVSMVLVVLALLGPERRDVRFGLQ